MAMPATAQGWRVHQKDVRLRSEHKLSIHSNQDVTVDYRESFSWRYEPQYDPDTKDPDAVLPEVQPYIRGEEYVWEGTRHLPEFKEGCITYWQEMPETRSKARQDLCTLPRLAGGLLRRRYHLPWQ